MTKPFVFAAPTPVAYGVNRVDEIGADVDRLAGKKISVLVLSDPGVVQAGLAQRVVKALEMAGHCPVLFSNIKSDPRSV